MEVINKPSGKPLTTQPSGLLACCHASAAGSAGTRGPMQPAATLADPPAKRERRSPSPHAVVIPQASADGADISLEMSSDGDSPGLRAGLGAPILDASTPRSGLALPPGPVAKTGRVVKARSASASTRGVTLTRGVSPTPR